MSRSNFFQSEYLLHPCPLPRPPATQIALEPTLREAAEHGGIAPITRPKRSRRRGKVWKRDSFGLKPLQPIEIPQNRQSFVWKSLEKNDRDLEKLGENAWRCAFVPPPLPPP